MPSILSTTYPPDGIKRVIIKNINPIVACGNYPAKGAIDTPLIFSANIFADGHDTLYARLQIKKAGQKKWQEVEMLLLANDKWEASFLPETIGILEFRIQAWVSEIASWKDSFDKMEKAGADTSIEQLKGIEILQHILKETSDPKLKQEIQNSLKEHEGAGLKPDTIHLELFNKLLKINPKEKTSSSKTYKIDIQRQKAQFSTWYELFPRSCSTEEGKHGTFRDVVSQLPRLADAGFDVLYLPPIHPIGKEKRKGKNNSLTATAEDPGSPWAIGNDEGGHKSIHKELGDLKDFKYLLNEAKKQNIEIALDIAFQCAPDHPYVKEHPEWFKWRPDGTVQYAENPPKKYEDILPFDFESKEWHSLWQELLSVFNFWIDKGVKIFRVDNPHTKSLRFWEWLIAWVRKENPDVLFLAEAFTQPNIMEYLAMIGFTQSYTYFTWRNTKQELEEYVTELTKGSKQYYFRPNFWPNTPDILPAHLVEGGENAHIIRFLLAATLSSNYGIYGPVFERAVNEPARGKEEYTDNEKYEIKYWPPVAEMRIWGTIKQTNKLRKTFKALQMTNNIEFLESTNDQIIAYLKTDPLTHHHLIIIINLDPYHAQSGLVYFNNEATRKFYGTEFKVTDHLNNETYYWNNNSNYVALDPNTKPAHILSIS